MCAARRRGRRRTLERKAQDNDKET